jgi:hypothetical protein
VQSRKPPKRFRINALGFKEGFRPPFNFPGVWLYCGNDKADDGVVHINGSDLSDPSGSVESRGERFEVALVGGGAVDHIAFTATDMPDRYRLLNAAEMP